MPLVHALPAAATLLAAAAVPFALAACSPGTHAPAARATTTAARATANPDLGLLTGTQLQRLLAPPSYFPAGFAPGPAGASDSGPGYQLPTASRVRTPDCRLLGGTSWTTITGIGGVSFAQNDYLGRARSAEIAQEIDVYPGGTARTVLRKLGGIATACPSYTDPQTHSRTRVGEEARPRLGDGGYVITVTDPAWRGGTTLVAARAGTAVVTVLSTAGPGNGHASALKLASHLVAALQGGA
jgi:hypothetical protein